jgi:tripartite-type tricarboxylate transporter receptor subunit TctC
MAHIPYRGTAPAVTDLIAGQVQIMLDNLPGSIEYVHAGNTRALAVTTTARSDELPDVPTVADFVPGYEVSAWFGLGAPRNTPKEIIDRLNEEINAALMDAKMKARLTDRGGIALAGSPADFGKLISEETEKWGQVVRVTNMKPE